jgi:hypothetical protein
VVLRLNGLEEGVREEGVPLLLTLLETVSESIFKLRRGLEVDEGKLLGEM